jgi:hypothetical protein
LHTQNKGWLAFAATGSEVGNLLKTQYYNYKNTVTGEKVVACEKCVSTFYQMSKPVDIFLGIMFLTMCKSTSTISTLESDSPGSIVDLYSPDRIQYLDQCMNPRPAHSQNQLTGAICQVAMLP